MSRNDFFKGWYFKCTEHKHTIAFIPSIHYNESGKSACLQIITDDKAFCLTYPSLTCRGKPLLVKIGNSVFSERGIKLDIKKEKISARGTVRFSGNIPLRYDIMGPFKYVPFMQCRHSVYSMYHRIDGELLVNGERYIFHNGVGYIEGDGGRSFPERYIWTQCGFSGGSLMLSVADIPLGVRFTGIIGIVLLNGKEYRIATYLGAKLKYIGNDTVTVSQGGCELTARLISQNAHPLSAPVNGKVSKTIHESASCTAYYKFSYNNAVLCEFTSERASFEFEYPEYRLL